MVTKTNKPTSIHCLVSLFGCDNQQLNSLKFWKHILPEAVKKSSMTILHKFYYQFNPQGITGFLLLSSSHLSIHTWPEHHYVACDIFSCSNDGDAKKVVDYLVKNVKHKKAEIKFIRRGYIV